MNIEEQLSNELRNSVKIQKEMQATIDELTTENTFLTETITAQRLGKITTERRDLQAQMYMIQSEAKSKLEEAKKIRSRYEKAMSDAETIKKGLLDKEENVDKYIEKESSRKISEKLSELEKEKAKCKKLLDKQIYENDNVLNKQIILYNQKRKKWLIILSVAILITILSICINFM